MKRAKKKRIKEILNTLKKKELKDVKKNLGKKIVKKFRYVDPKIILDGKLLRLSKIMPKFQRMINKHREINKKGLIV